MKALIFENKIVDTSENEFEVHSSMTWMDCPDECKAYSWTLVDGVFIAPAELPAITYDKKRKAEYPTIEECVHAILDDGLTALQVLRQAVKDKYPKP
jgi:hypothetical protein|tara:strand:+ start:714 stop:1004 length:291 start_codon:yes stop_codon:yes gene_type:complete